MHHCIYSCKAELDEIRRGLLSLGFIGLMEKYRVVRSLFVSNQSAQLTADALQDLFVANYSP